MASEREHPPSKRFGWTRKIRVGGQKLFLTCNEYLDGRPCEVFLVAAKTGTLVQSMLSAWAISVSSQLQHGVPLEDIVCSFEHTKFEPCGVVSGDAEIRQASSLLDYIVKRLKLDYLTPKETAPSTNGDVPPPEIESPEPPSVELNADRLAGALVKLGYPVARAWEVAHGIRQHYDDDAAPPAPPVVNGEVDDKSWDTKPAGYRSQGSGA